MHRSEDYDAPTPRVLPLGVLWDRSRHESQNFLDNTARSRHDAAVRAEEQTEAARTRWTKMELALVLAEATGRRLGAEAFSGKPGRCAVVTDPRCRRAPASTDTSSNTVLRPIALLNAWAIVMAGALHFSSHGNTPASAKLNAGRRRFGVERHVSAGTACRDAGRHNGGVAPRRFTRLARIALRTWKCYYTVAARTAERHTGRMSPAFSSSPRALHSAPRSRDR